MYINSRRFFKEYLPGKGKGYFLGIICLLVTIVTTTSIPLFIKDAINLLSNADNNLTESARQELLRLAVYILVMGIILCVSRFMSRYFLFLQGRRIEAEVRQHLFKAVVTMPIDQINQYQSGDLISRGTNDVTSVRVMVSMGILHSINSLIFLSLCLFHMFRISPKLTLLCLIPLPLAILATRFLSKRMMLAGRASQEQLGVLSETVREQFRAHTLLSVFPVFKLLNTRFDKDNNSYTQKAEELMSIRVFMMLTVVIILSLGFFILLRFGGPEAIHNEQLGQGGFDLGAFTAFSIFLVIMQGPLRATGFLLPLMQRGEICLTRIYEIRDAAAAALKIDNKRPIDSEDKIP